MLDFDYNQRRVVDSDSESGDHCEDESSDEENQQNREVLTHNEQGGEWLTRLFEEGGQENNGVNSVDNQTKEKLEEEKGGNTSCCSQNKGGIEDSKCRVVTQTNGSANCKCRAVLQEHNIGSEGQPIQRSNWVGLSSHESEKFEKMLDSMGVKMISTDNKGKGDERRKIMTGKKGIRELRNLSCDVKYDKGGEGSKGRRGDKSYR